MKTCPFVSCLLLVCLLLGGCAFMSEEDRDFYGKGWIKPTDLDKQDSRHFYGDPTTLPTAVPATRSAAPQPAPEWITPETVDRPH